MIDVARATIEFEGGMVAMVYFEVDGIDAHFAGFFFDEGHGLTAIATAAMSGGDEQLVNERVVATEFEAEPDGQDDVANERGAFVQEPDAAKRGK